MYYGNKDFMEVTIKIQLTIDGKFYAMGPMFKFYKQFLMSYWQGNYKDLLNMKESSRLRLDALREATLKEEQEYNDLVAVEKKQQALKDQLELAHPANGSHTKVETMLDEILQEVALAADKLEVGIEEHAFDKSKMVGGLTHSQ